MEWVETTGRSVEEAKEAALDELGVDEQDAEFEIVAEARNSDSSVASDRKHGYGLECGLPLREPRTSVAGSVAGLVDGEPAPTGNGS